MVINERRIQRKIRKRGRKIIKRIRRRFNTAIDRIPEQVGLNKEVGVEF